MSTATSVEILDVLVEPGAVVELRAPKAGRRGTISGYFDDLAALLGAAEKLSGTVAGVYFTVNPVKPALLARAANRAIERAELTTGDHDVDRRCWLPIDLDPVRPAGICATAEEHEAAVQRARDIAGWMMRNGWPEPLVMDSGNGVYVLLRIDLPNDDDARELVRRCLAGLAFQFDDDHVHVDQTMFNAARIIRVPGTLNCKGDDTPARPHRPVRPVYVPAALEPVGRELLERLAAVVPKEEQPNGQHGNYRGGAGDFDLERFVREHLSVLREGPWSNGGYRWVLRECPFHPDHTDKAPWVARRASGAIVAGCQHNSCTWDWAELREKYEPGYRERRQQGGTRREGSRIYSNGSGPAAEEPYRPTAPTPGAFPTGLLPPVLKDLAEDSPTGLPAAFLGIAGLGAMAGAIGAGAVLEIAETWREWPVLHIAIVAPPGTAKTPALDLVARPLFHIEADLQEGNRAVMAQWLAAKAAAKEAKKAFTEPRPKLKELVAMDFTSESLVARLEDNPGGLVVVRDELSGLLSGLNQYRGGHGEDRERLLRMWDCKPMKTSRVQIEGNHYVELPIVSIVGATTPKGAARFAGDDGLRGRWLIGHFPDMRPVTSAVVADSSGRVRRWGELLQGLYAARDVRRPVSLSPLARDVWDDYQRDLLSLWDDLGEADQDLVGKFRRAQVLRIALVLWIGRHPYEYEPDVIDETTMAAAAAIARWFLEQALSNPALGPSPAANPQERELDRGVDSLASWLRRRADHKAPTGEVRRHKVGSVRTSAECDRLIARYVATYPGHARAEARPQGGGEFQVVYAPGYLPAEGAQS